MQNDHLRNLGLFVQLGLESVNLGTGDNTALAPNHHIFHQLAMQS